MIKLDLDPNIIGWDVVKKIMALLEGVTPPVEPTPGPQPQPGPQPPQHVVLEVEEKHARKEIVGTNKKGKPIMGNIKGQRAEQGEVYWCEPQRVRADGGGYYWKIIARNSPDPSTVMKGDYLDGSKVI